MGMINQNNSITKANAVRGIRYVCFLIACDILNSVWFYVAVTAGSNLDIHYLLQASLDSLSI